MPDSGRSRERLLEELAAAQRSSEASRESEAALRALLDATADVVMLCEPDGRVVASNTAAARRFGYLPEDFVGVNTFELVSPEVAQARKNIGAEVLRTGQPVQFRDEREGRILENTVYPIVSPSGARSRFAIFSEDVTEQAQAEERRRKLEVRLQRAQKLESLGILAGGIAHDFNNILTGLLGNVDLALCELPDESAARPLLDDVKREARRAANLTHQMLAYSGQSKFVIEDVDINAMVESMSSLLASSTSEKVELKYELAPGLPAARADATQLQQIALNLVSNASEAMGQSDGVVSVKTYETVCAPGCVVCAGRGSELPPGTYVTLEVTDTGCGMDDETRSRIFDPFFTTKLTGRGLGLAAVQGIVRGHQGAILVDSAPDEGTTFKVLLPALDHALAEAGPTEPKTPWRGSGLVLVADDEKMVRRVVAGALELAGFSVLTASDGAEAVQLFLEHHRDVACVLLDSKMPRMNGADAYRGIRRIRPDVPVILISGYSEETSVEGLDELAGYLQKPFDAATLHDAVRGALTQK